MAVDLNFASLFQNLNSEDHWLPSKPWESIASESGVSQSEISISNSSLKPIYDPSTISEANMVRLVINALQGVQSSLDIIEKLSASFCSDPADRTSHRIPSLWHWSSSTNALGKILRSIGHSGSVVFLARKFVDYFLCTNLNVDEDSRENERETKQVDSECEGGHRGREAIKHPSYSLVNQAFSVAVQKLLEGYICALDTLFASVEVRRSSKNVDDVSSLIPSEVGCLTRSLNSEITLLEVYLHTKELRTNMEALGNICSLQNIALNSSISSLENLTAKATLEFQNFPRGGNLLTYLYAQLRDADPVHHALLKFLFLRSYAPYCDFIRSWIYQARTSDPYKEFIVDYVDDRPSYSYGKAGFYNDFPLVIIKERDGVSLPCFLKEFCLPLFRAGQQLQVLIKLLEMCNYVSARDATYEDILPFWSGESSDHSSYLSPLTFNKINIQGLVLKRNSIYKRMQEKLITFVTGFGIRYRQVVRYDAVPIFVDNCRGSLKIPVPVTSDGSLIFSSSTVDKGDTNLSASTMDSDVSSTIDEFSCVVDPLESSECSSLHSSEEQNESEGLHDSVVGLEQRYLYALGSSPSFAFGNLSQKPIQSEKPHAVECNSRKTCDEMDPISHSVHPHKGTKLSHISARLQSEEPTWSRTSETPYADCQSDMCWPLGGLSKNPFYVVGGYRGETQFHISDCSLTVTNRNIEVLNGGISLFGEVSPSDNSVLEQATDKNQFENGTYASSNSFIFPSCKLKCPWNLLNINPMLTKNAWLDLTGKPGDRRCTDNKRSFPYFDFSSVEDPCKVYGERFLDSPVLGFRSELPLFTDSGVSAAFGGNDYLGEQGHNENDVLVDQTKLSYAYSPSGSSVNLQKDSLENVSGGAEWESLLSYSDNSDMHSVGGERQSSTTMFEIPLDVIIYKCIQQEILLQYKYISNFTIKLLEEGFELREHLLALRRYHFMEIADWADLFIMSLWNHVPIFNPIKWCVAEADQRISEIQGFLNRAVQRSSCERHHYEDRLFVYMKGQGMMPFSTSAIGVHSFDFIALGYRVDWPVSIVLTPDALEIYAEIFSFLVQVKLAVFSLTDIWCSLKDLMHLNSQSGHSGLDEKELIYFNILMKMRHQVNHFVCTLQQYVQSQLLHVSWCRFLHSVKHQVKDILDLELVHMSYLSDSLQICFLSNETRSVAHIIENVLQCALDLRLCLTGDVWEFGSDQRDSSGLLSCINCSQVLSIKGTFDKNLKELHFCYLKSPKHGEFGLSRFWGYLNYNDYYSNIIGNGISHNVF